MTQNPLSLPKVALGKTCLKVSPIGFGGYRVSAQIQEHREALQLALTSGCNLIDTSTNYGDGQSEILIGEVIQDLVENKKLRREDVVVVSKIGYVQGENLTLAQQRKERGLGFKDMVEYGPDCWHCISPEFLRDQLGRSLSRLKLQSIDIVLLHNPEYFLKSGGDHAQYYKRIKAAFEHLETEVSQGRIKYYGISSNTLPHDKEEADATSLEVLNEIAEEIGAKHFAVIQFPFNLYEPDAALGDLLETAQKSELGTLINRPLNAFYGNKLIRLADFPSHPGRDVEDELKEAFLSALQTESDYPGKKFLPAKEVAWAHILRQNFEKLHDLEGWKNILDFQIKPAMLEAEDILSQYPEMKTWLDDYLTDSEALFNSLTAYLEEITSVLSKKISKLLDETAPALKSSKTLSQKALRIYRSFSGVHCVLVGMRKTDYVRDSLEFFPPLTQEQALGVLKAIQHDIHEGASETHEATH
jgi:aryl-alcohol dehydrogenase-like predicted oxidoreductase